jgi:hypothetical protein
VEDLDIRALRLLAIYDPAMSESTNGHLDKAKAALDHARELMESVDADADISSNPSLNRVFLRAVDLAAVQASVAQAAALEQIAEHLGYLAHGAVVNKLGKTVGHG